MLHAAKGRPYSIVTLTLSAGLPSTTGPCIIIARKRSRLAPSGPHSRELGWATTRPWESSARRTEIAAGLTLLPIFGLNYDTWFGWKSFKLGGKQKSRGRRRSDLAGVGFYTYRYRDIESRNRRYRYQVLVSPWENTRCSSNEEGACHCLCPSVARTVPDSFGVFGQDPP